MWFLNSWCCAPEAQLPRTAWLWLHLSLAAEEPVQRPFYTSHLRVWTSQEPELLVNRCREESPALPPSEKRLLQRTPSPVGLRWDSHAPGLTCDKAILRPIYWLTDVDHTELSPSPRFLSFRPPRPLEKPLLEICRPQESRSLMDCPIIPPTSPHLSSLVLFPPPWKSRALSCVTVGTSKDLTVEHSFFCNRLWKEVCPYISPDLFYLTYFHF